MSSNSRQAFRFMALVLVLSIPFYLWGALFPVAGLPFGLPISFLMIFVPGGLALVHAWRTGGAAGLRGLLAGILDLRGLKAWALVFSLACMPAVAVLSYWSMVLAGLALPDPARVSLNSLPLMLLLYFLGAIPEELGWTATLTAPLAEEIGPLPAGAIIGLVWAVWHVIPWSWAHPAGWIAGMIALNVLMRIGMVYAYLAGGRALFSGLVFHTMINVSFGLFPNEGSHANPGVMSVWMGAAVLFLALYFRAGRGKDLRKFFHE